MAALRKRLLRGTMNIEVMRNTLHQSEAGQLTFPMVISSLSAVGVESYFADLARRTDTFYLPNGETHVEAMDHPSAIITEDFSKSEIVAAIRAAQADQIRYPEFIKRAMAAGTTAYWVFLTGRKVIYFGRKGDLHIEEFPAAKS
jgi:uncharacterized protein YbcV (DUF1398 family)